MSEKTDARFHELANSFPLILGDDFEELVEDIKVNGLFSPVVMYEGKILDGRNRWLACQRLGIAHTERKFTGEDAAAFVWSANAIRRQLSISQKALAAVKLADAAHGAPEGNQNAAKNKDAAPRPSSAVTLAQAAEMTGVGERTIQEAGRVLRNAVPGVIDAVEQGELTVHTAHRVAQLPREEQQRIIDTVPVDEIGAAVPPTRKMSTPRKTPAAAPEPETPQGPGRGNVGPKVSMIRQMEAYSSEGARNRTKTWAENKEVIPDLDPEMLTSFVKDLRANRRAIEQLVKLIELTLKQQTKND